jgi:hypothetical protein
MVRNVIRIVENAPNAFFKRAMAFRYITTTLTRSSSFARIPTINISSKSGAKQGASGKLYSQNSNCLTLQGGMPALYLVYTHCCKARLHVSNKQQTGTELTTSPFNPWINQYVTIWGSDVDSTSSFVQIHKYNDN